jgi:hypothetical protein
MELLLDQQERDAVAINPSMVRDEFVAFPGLLSSFGARYADAISFAAEKSEALEDIEAEVYLELRAGKTKEQTEAMLNAMVRRDTRVRMARELYLQAEATKLRFRHKVMDPLYAKKDMLISIGAHQRAELSGDPMIKHARRESVDELEARVFTGR